mmetsp:Transcript_62135/g.189726  ORF Transcript_62135/g.189726 Transcript_62135/m.189726 type:complete len:274 (+) Transcript_62135:418-1239(+)
MRAAMTAATMLAAGVPHSATPLWPVRPKHPSARFAATSTPIGAATARARSSNHWRRDVTFLENVKETKVGREASLPASKAPQTSRSPVSDHSNRRSAAEIKRDAFARSPAKFARSSARLSILRKRPSSAICSSVTPAKRVAPRLAISVSTKRVNLRCFATPCACAASVKQPPKTVRGSILNNFATSNFVTCTVVSPKPIAPRCSVRKPDFRTTTKKSIRGVWVRRVYRLTLTEKVPSGAQPSGQNTFSTGSSLTVCAFMSTSNFPPHLLLLFS